MNDAICTLLSGRLYRGSGEAAGFDLYSTITFELHPKHRLKIPTGVRTRIRPGYYGLIRDRSGLAANHGICCIAGVIDSDYRDEWKVVLLNTGWEPVWIKEGDRIAQVLFMKSESKVVVEGEAEVIQGGVRVGGFGSSGL